MNQIRTVVKHSKTNDAWNVVGIDLGRKYKIARVPYVTHPNDEAISTMNKFEALEHAQFISYCFNHYKEIKSNI